MSRVPDGLQPRQDPPLEVERLIDGVVIRRLFPNEDKRGELVELYRDAWDIHPEPLVYSYMVTLRPGAIRGWAMHKLQDDRIAIVSGFFRWALFDNRPDSPTYRELNVLTLSERNRALFTIPKNVIHAAQNIGTTEALFINYPTREYDRANPDKYRIDHDSGLIPFRFDDGAGW
ncbi:MAG TPA: dTDP-4-dehydrorhamnose 3,5-epimerase family protein [Thermoanaerobaculia bacterium]|nr:dTDP-4-dehydrorhamnose 3,5-epimerase family protein [Thermoanaerobaculia bacterium]